MARIYMWPPDVLIFLAVDVAKYMANLRSGDSFRGEHEVARGWILSKVISLSLPEEIRSDGHLPRR